MLYFQCRMMRWLLSKTGPVILAFFLCDGYPCHAQLPDYNVQLFDYTYGIRPGNIIGITRDREGFLWILYIRSVQRFDGKRTITFQPQGVLRTIHCDPAGRLWVTSDTEVYLFDHSSRTFQPVPLDAETGEHRVGHVFTVPDQGTWLFASHAFYTYDAEQNRFLQQSRDTFFNPGFHSRVYSGFDDTGYFARGNHVYRMHMGSGLTDSMEVQDLRDVYAIDDHVVLIGTWGVSSYWYDFDTRHIERVRVSPFDETALPEYDMSVRSVAIAARHKRVISSREGLYEYDTRASLMSPVRLFHRGVNVNTHDLASIVYFDQDWYVWMVTPEGLLRFSVLTQNFGLMRIRQFISDELPFGVDHIRSIAEDENDVLWLATGHGFVSWDRKTNITRVYPPEQGSDTRLAYPSIRGIAYDGHNLILAPTDLGIWIFNPRTERYFRPVYDNETVRTRSMRDFFDAICPLRNGNYILPGRDALYLLEKETYRLSFIDVPGANENTNYVFEGHSGEIWLATHRGLHLLDNDLNYLATANLQDGGRSVSAGVVLPDNLLLVSLEGGLYTARATDGSIVVDKYTDVFDGKFLSNLYFDWKGILWAASEEGIYRYDPETATVNLFDHSDNLQGYGFYINATYQTRDSFILFGGTNGLNYFRPNQFRVDAGEITVYIESVQLGRDRVIYDINDKQFELSYADRSVEVSFASPYFNNPEKLRYRYRLDGLDTDWKDIGSDNRLRLTSLSPGAYTLRLEASINNVDWNSSPNTFAFRILPPFWQTWWFVSLMLAAAGLGFGAFVRNRNNRIREQQEELEAEQAINYFSSRMTGHESVEQLLQDVAANCIGRLQFEECIIYLLDSEKQFLQPVAAHGPGMSTQPPDLLQDIHIDEGNIGAVAKYGTAMILAQSRLSPGELHDPKKRRSEILVPLVSEGHVLGVIVCRHSIKRFFTQRHLSILTTIASLCAARIVKAKTEAEKNATERILMETKQQMADIEMQALRAQMNPHFIFNCLNSINRYIVKSDQATASLYLTRFAKLIRLILDNSNSKVITLSNELEALRLYIEMESIRFEKQFACSIEVDEHIHPDHVFVPPLIIQPFVENAIWHGLLHKETSGHLAVKVKMPAPAKLECIIEDNGVGRARARELKSKSASTNKSLGMKLTESRLKLLSTFAEWDTAIEIADLTDDKGAPAGTRVVLRIPVDV